MALYCCPSQLHDWKLFLGVLSLVVVDVIILTVYTIVESIHGLEETGIVEHQVLKVTNEENPQDELGVCVVMRHVYTISSPFRFVIHKAPKKCYRSEKKELK